MAVRLKCDSCGQVAPGEFESYEAWEDAARELGWFVGEEVVLCDRCG